MVQFFLLYSFVFFFFLAFSFFYLLKSKFCVHSKGSDYGFPNKIYWSHWVATNKIVFLKIIGVGEGEMGRGLQHGESKLWEIRYSTNWAIKIPNKIAIQNRLQIIFVPYVSPTRLSVCGTSFISLLMKDATKYSQGTNKICQMMSK